MNILEIDCISFATRVAYTAGVELSGLLQGADEFDSLRTHLGFLRDYKGDIEEVVQEIGRYICVRNCQTGEQLFNHMRDLRKFGFVPRWQDMQEVDQLAQTLLVDVCRETYGKLKALQDQAEAAVVTSAQVSEPLKVEDSIFEEVGSMAELDPDRLGALDGIARMDRDKAEAKAAQEEADKKQRAKAAKDVRAAKAKQAVAPMSAGEKPPSVTTATSKRKPRAKAAGKAKAAAKSGPKPAARAKQEKSNG